MDHKIELHTAVADYTVYIYSHRDTARSKPVYYWFIERDGHSIASSMAFTHNLGETLYNLNSYVVHRFGFLVASQLNQQELPEGF